MTYFMRKKNVRLLYTVLLYTVLLYNVLLYTVLHVYCIFETVNTMVLGPSTLFWDQIMILGSKHLKDQLWI